MSRWVRTAVALSFAVALGLTAAGCADGRAWWGGRAAPAPSTPAATAAAPAAAETAGTSAVLLFVASGRVGDGATVTDAYFGGDVRVRIEEEYSSASGRLCRRFSAARPRATEGQIFYACQSGGAWALAGLY